MKVGHETPKIIRFTYRQEPGDKGYGSCLWADFDLDLAGWSMSIRSDVGNYAYGWTPEKGTNFLKFCTHIAGDYLIHKLCGGPEEVDVDGTYEQICEDVRSCCGDKADEFIKDLRRRLAGPADREKCSDRFKDSRLLEEALDGWNDENDLGFYNLWEYIRYDYSAWQKRIVEIFSEHIRPAIRQYMKDEAEAEVL